MVVHNGGVHWRFLRRRFGHFQQGAPRVHARVKRDGWTENNVAKGGTGYIVSSDAKGCGLAYCPKYWEAVPELKKVDPAPSAIIVPGGRNDYKAGMEKVAPNVAKTFQDIRRAYPKAVIVSLPPFYAFQPLPASLAEMGEVVKRETLAVGGVYLDIGQPLLNKPKLVGADDAHPRTRVTLCSASVTVDMLRKQKIADKMPKPSTEAPTAAPSATAPSVKSVLTADWPIEAVSVWRKDFTGAVARCPSSRVCAR